MPETAKNIVCYRCGASLAALTLPLSRYDECPQCSVSVRVCRMCENYAPDVPRKCTEDDAEEVMEKVRVNFCEWFKPGEDLFDGAEAGAVASAQASLAALFGDTDSVEDPAGSSSDEVKSAEDLFK